MNIKNKWISKIEKNLFSGKKQISTTQVGLPSRWGQRDDTENELQWGWQQLSLRSELFL